MLRIRDISNNVSGFLNLHDQKPGRCNSRHTTTAGKFLCRGGWILEGGGWILDGGGWILDGGGWVLDDRGLILEGGWVLDGGGCVLKSGGWEGRSRVLGGGGRFIVTCVLSWTI